MIGRLIETLVNLLLVLCSNEAKMCDAYVTLIIDKEKYQILVMNRPTLLSYRNDIKNLMIFPTKIPGTFVPPIILSCAIEQMFKLKLY